MRARERAHVIDILPYTVIFFVGKQYHKGRLVVVAKRYAMEIGRASCRERV